MSNTILAGPGISFSGVPTYPLQVKYIGGIAGPDALTLDPSDFAVRRLDGSIFEGPMSGGRLFDLHRGRELEKVRKFDEADGYAKVFGGVDGYGSLIENTEIGRLIYIPAGQDLPTIVDETDA